MDSVNQLIGLNKCYLDSEYTLDAERELNVNKTLRRSSEDVQKTYLHSIYVLCSRGSLTYKRHCSKQSDNRTYHTTEKPDNTNYGTFT